MIPALVKTAPNKNFLHDGTMKLLHKGLCQGFLPMSDELPLLEILKTNPELCLNRMRDLARVALQSPPSERCISESAASRSPK